MSKRKILYGYRIQNGVLTVSAQEGAVVERIAMLYIEGLSYQKISDLLNKEQIPFSAEVPLWKKHKVKRLLENSRYTGADEYPPILKQDIFQKVQRRIREKTANHRKREKPAERRSPVEKTPAATYDPSSEVIRLTNAINRGLENPEKPEEVISLILQGVAARYECLK